MKKIYALLFTLTFFILMPLSIEASSLYEDAVYLPRNDAIHDGITEKNDLTHFRHDTDSKIYKVLLGSYDEESLTLVEGRGKTFDVEIMDKEGNLIIQRDGIGLKGNRQVKFPTNYVGEYYISIKSSNDGVKGYPYSVRVIVGEPVYLSVNPIHKVYLNTTSISSSKTTSAIQYFDLTNVNSIPNDAILTDIAAGGTEINRNITNLYSLKRSIRPDSAPSSNWIHAEYSLFQPFHLDRVPKHAQVKVKQRYAYRISARFDYSGTHTLSQPYVNIGYKREMK